MSYDRNEAIQIIKAELKRRSGKTWSVTGGKGTARGWITIVAPPKRCKYEWASDTPSASEFGYMSLADSKELAELLGLSRPVHPQGESIPASGDYREEYVARAKGETPKVYGQQYWD